MNIKKYFWELNEETLKNTADIILKNPGHPKYISMMVTLLTRCDNPKEIFSLISKEQFVNSWPGIRKYWKKSGHSPDFLAWWETIYEQIIDRKPAGSPAKFLIDIGKKIKKARLDKGWNQSELAKRARLDQADISKIEKGQINITIETLNRLIKVLNIRHLHFDFQ